MRTRSDIAFSDHDRAGADPQNCFALRAFRPGSFAAVDARLGTPLEPQQVQRFQDVGGQPQHLRKHAPIQLFAAVIPVSFVGRQKAISRLCLSCLNPEVTAIDSVDGLNYGAFYSIKLLFTRTRSELSGDFSHYLSHDYYANIVSAQLPTISS